MSKYSKVDNWQEQIRKAYIMNSQSTIFSTELGEHWYHDTNASDVSTEKALVIELNSREHGVGIKDACLIVMLRKDTDLYKQLFESKHASVIENNKVAETDEVVLVNMGDRFYFEHDDFLSTYKITFDENSRMYKLICE